MQRLREMDLAGHSLVQAGPGDRGGPPPRRPATTGVSGFRKWFITWALTWLTWVLAHPWQGTWRTMLTCFCVAGLIMLYLEHRWPDEPRGPTAG